MSYSPIEETTSIAIPDRDVLDQPPRNRTNATSVSDSETTSTSSEDDSRSDHLASRRNRSALKFKHHAVPQSPSGNTDHCVGAEKDTLHVPEPSHEESTQTQATTLSHASTTASEYGKETLDVQSYAEDKRQITAVQRTQNLPTLSSKSKSASSNTSPDVIQAPAADSNVPRSKSVEETDSASTVRLQYAEGDASSETTRDHETPTSHRESPPPLETNSTNQVEPRPKEDPRRVSTYIAILTVSHMNIAANSIFQQHSARQRKGLRVLKLRWPSSLLRGKCSWAPLQNCLRL